MIFQLTEDEILKVCKGCESFDGQNCRATSPEKPLSQVRRCKKWDDHYGNRCVRK